MQYKVVRVEEKNKDWKVIDIEMGDNSYQHNVSVNRMNKKGEVFPNFDAIAVGQFTEGELWESGSSKWYLFAPKQKPARSPGGGSAAIAKAQETKAHNIEAAQDRKEASIQKAAAFRDATLLTVEWIKQTPFPTDDEIKGYWRAWVKFFLGVADEPFI